MPAFMYILKCSDNSYYTGSARSIDLRLDQHQIGKGSKYTSTRLPIELVYLEEYPRIDEAFHREKQVQGWSRKKKEALMNNDWQSLHELAMCQNASTTLSNPASLRLRSGQATTLSTLSQKDSTLSQKDSTLSQKGNTLGQKGGALSGVEGYDGTETYPTQNSIKKDKT